MSFNFSPVTNDNRIPGVTYRPGSISPTPADMADAARTKAHDDLIAEFQNYKNVAPAAQSGVESDSRRAGTYSNTAQAGAQRKAESDVETKFGQDASVQRMNALRQSLGLGATDPNNPALPQTQHINPAFALPGGPMGQVMQMQWPGTDSAQVPAPTQTPTR